MPRVKPKRTVPRLDMTPMVDLAFLLVTFFMLTTKFRPDEPVTVDIPSSTAQKPILDKDIITITVAQDGRAFVDMAGKHDRTKWIQKINETKNLHLTAHEQDLFSNLSSVGVPFNKLAGYLDLPSTDRTKFHQDGIPYDSTNNELATWLQQARAANQNARVLIKGDRDADYSKVKKVITTLTEEAETHRFNFITSMKVK